MTTTGTRYGIVTSHVEQTWTTMANVENLGEVEFSSMAFHHGKYPPKIGDRLEMTFRDGSVVSVCNEGQQMLEVQETR